MQSTWSCDGCTSAIRFDEDAQPMECFAQGILVGLRMAHHRKKCAGSHHENGNIAVPSLESTLLAAVVDGKSWEQIAEEA